MTLEVTDKPWSELSKEERSARIKAGRERAVAARTAKSEAKAKRQDAAESPSRQMSEAEVRAARARLLNELASLPDEPQPSGAMPGTTIKDGLGEDKVPWTPATIRDACTRNLTIGGHAFSWKEILGDGKTVSVSWNGIVYWLWPDRMNKIPSVHYDVYMQSLEDRRREAARWRSPASPGTGNLDGFNSAEAHSSEIGAPSNLGHIMGVGALEPRGE